MHAHSTLLAWCQCNNSCPWSQWQLTFASEFHFPEHLSSSLFLSCRLENKPPPSTNTCCRCHWNSCIIHYMLPLLVTDGDISSLVDGQLLSSSMCQTHIFFDWTPPEIFRHPSCLGTMLKGQYNASVVWNWRLCFGQLPVSHLMFLTKVLQCVVATRLEKIPGGNQ